MRQTETITNYQELKERMDEQHICCELVSGHLLRVNAASEEGSKLCFLLGTLLTDYLMERKLKDRIVYGKEEIVLDDYNIFRPDMYTYDVSSKNEEKNLKMAIEILTENNVIYDLVDKAFGFKGSGIKEYWVLDLGRQQVYLFTYKRGIHFRRYGFDQKIECECYPGFDCCISDVMWQDTGCLRQLALFYRFKKDMPDKKTGLMLNEEPALYNQVAAQQYTADMFYEWINVRKNLPRIREKTELICGEISQCLTPSFRQQNIRGNLYFVIRQLLHQTGSRFQVCFAPTAVEMKQKGILDSVVMPDLFLIPVKTIVNDNVYCGVPSWIIEIATPASAAKDYIDKAQIYQFHGVEEYWIINDWKRQTMVMRGGLSGIRGDGSMDMQIYDYDDAIPVGLLENKEICMRDVMSL